MTPELIAKVAERMGWRFSAEHGVWADNNGECVANKWSGITDSGIVALLEWLMHRTDDDWVHIEHSLGRYYVDCEAINQTHADTLAEALCLAVVGEQT